MASDIGRVMEMINGYRQTCIVVAAIRLGVFDRLAAGPVADAALAGELEADPGALSRLLRALAVLGLVDREDGASALTATGRLLTGAGFGAGLRAWAVLVGAEYMAAWGHLADSVRTGAIGFERAFGTTAWEHRASHPELGELFNVVTSGEQVRTIAALVRGYDFSGRRCIVDVGGGHGNLVAGVLARYPDARGVVFDLPHVVEGAPEALERAGVADRCQVVGGSFLDQVPPGGDVYLLKHVLHNWDDTRCTEILRSCRQAMAPGAVLLVLENVVPDDPSTAEELVMLDLHMMAVHGGRERTEGELDTLLATAGLRRLRRIATRPGAPDVIEAGMDERSGS